jgi:DNA replication protein DnaC
VLELMKGQYIDERDNVLFIGSSGVGKTHVAIASGSLPVVRGGRCGSSG